MAAAGPGWLNNISLHNFKFSPLHDIIDIGTFGCVVKASHIIRISKHKKIKKTRAIKFINVHELCRRGQYKSLDAAIDRIQHEIKIHKQLDHPNIVKMYENGYTSIPDCTDIIVYIVMSYVSGQTLLHHINDIHYRTTEIIAREYFLQILSALEYLHEKGISHRDLKLENIMMTKHNKLILLDFGLSCQSGNKLSYTMCGSPMYAAPELWLGKPYHGPTVDVWALGIILYAILFASYPFDDYFQTNQYALARRVVKHDITIPDHIMISHNLRRLIRDMLSRDIKKRIPIDEIRKRSWISYPPEKWSFKHGLRLLHNSDDAASSSSIFHLPETSSPRHDTSDTDSPRDMWSQKSKRSSRPISPLALHALHASKSNQIIISDSDIPDLTYH